MSIFGTKRHDDKEVVLLCTLSDPFRTDILLGVLEENKIPYLRHEAGGGSAAKLICGTSFFGSEIYVAVKDAERARALYEEMMQTFSEQIETTDADVEAAQKEQNEK